ncbi:MAG: tetratricopeptide repeat protein [Nitrospirota bacterium]
MGRKRYWEGKFIYFCIASLIFLFLFGCATPKDKDYLLRSQSLLERGDYEGALEENQRIFSMYPDSSPRDEALFNMGLIHAHYGNPKRDYEKALSFFWELIKEFPSSPRIQEAKIWVGVLNVLEETKKKEEEQRTIYDHLHLSRGLLEKGDYEESLEQNQRILSMYPNSPPGDEALFNMGLIYLHLKDNGNALSSFKELIEKFPQSSRSEEAEVLAELLNVMENTKAKKEEQKSAYGQLLRGQRLLAKGDYEGALEENQKVLATFPKRTPGDEALFNMGLIYAHYKNPKKDYGKSLSCFESLVKDYPQSPLHEQAKIWAEVLQTIEKLKKVDIEIEEKKKELSR